MLWRTRVRWQVRHNRDRVRKWCNRYKWCAWLFLRPDWLKRLDHQPANYRLNWVQNTSTIAKWLAGLSGAAMVLSIGFFIPAYLSILSIHDDCVSRRFVADAISGAVQFVEFSLVAGIAALAAIVWPAVICTRSNSKRWRRGVPRLQPGHEFDGWSERQVFWGWLPQGFFVFLSAACLSVLMVSLIQVGLRFATPAGVQKWWHTLELRCPSSGPPGES